MWLLGTEVSHSNEPFVFQQSHPFSLKWQTFRNSQEKQKVAFHENIPMSYYKPCSKILQKAPEAQKLRPSEEMLPSNCPTAQFFFPLSFLPLSHSCCISCWLGWKTWQKVPNFDYFDWKLKVNFIWQGHWVKQKVRMDKCPSDFISLVKICVLIQSLELILERGGLVERENPVFSLRIDGHCNVGVIISPFSGTSSCPVLSIYLD